MPHIANTCNASYAIDVLENKRIKCHSDLSLLQGYKLETKDYEK